MADNPNRLAGTVTLSADGQSYALVGSFSYKVAKVGRKSLVGTDGVHGFSQKPVVSQIKGTLRDTGALSVAAINQMDNVTVIAQLSNGKVIVGRNMWTAAEEGEDVNTDEATLEVTWEGPDVSEN